MSVATITTRWWNRRQRGTAAVPRVSRSVLLPVLTLLLVGSFLLGVGIGAVRIAPQQVVAIIANHVAGVELDVAYTEQQDAVVWAIRLPRVILAMLVGAGLAVSGAALQGLFRNPLADPGLIGVSSGASLGAVLVLGLGVTWLGVATTPLAAFIGGSITAVIGYLLARQGGRTEIVTLILAGIALNTFAGAGTALVTYVANDQQLRAIVFWSLGSLGGATWQNVVAATPFILLGLALSLRWGQALNLLVLGEREARHLGVDTERIRMQLILISAMMTGATVAVAGVVGFIGLIVPHLIRMIAGPDHRVVLPASALGGAILVLVADLASRVIVAPSELPLGVLTALLGGPFLLFLMMRTRRAEGGWG